MEEDDALELPSPDLGDGLGARISVPVEYFQLCRAALKLARVVVADDRSPEAGQIFCDFANADVRFLARHAVNRKLRLLK